jgi:hypothetical protein
MKRKLPSPFGTALLTESLFDKRIEDDTTTTDTRNVLILSIRKKVLLGMGVVLVSLFATVYYQYNKRAFQITDVSGESVSAGALLTAFSTNEVQANKKYLNHVLQVTGNVTEIKSGSNNNLQVLLDANDPMSTIACTMDNSKQEVKAGQQIIVKGICTGYLNDVVLIKCILVSHLK